MQPQDFATTARLVRRYAGPYLTDADLEDAVQAVTLRVWTVRDRFDGRRASEAHCPPYLFLTARSAVIDYLCHRSRCLDRERLTEPEHLRPPPAPSPEDELIGQQTADQIRRVFVRAWQSMSPRERERFREALGGRRMDAARSTYDTYTARAKVKILRAAGDEGCQDRFDTRRLRRLFAR